MIRTIQNRKSRYIATGKSCTTSMWDKKNNCIKKDHPLFREYSIYINDKILEAEKILMEYENKKKYFSSDQLKGEMQKKKLPMKVKWVRKAVCGDAESYAPNDILPILWYLEDQLSKGTNIFLYCDNMHGRVGMIAGCLLGRLYGLTLTNTLYRIQACHDCAKSESYLTTTKNPPVNCPNKSIYRGLIADVLELSNRPFEGTYGHA